MLFILKRVSDVGEDQVLGTRSKVQNLSSRIFLGAGSREKKPQSFQLLLIVQILKSTVMQDSSTKTSHHATLPSIARP